jgi:hypothetical protein
MKTSRLHKILAIINLSIIGLLIADTYLLKPIKTKEVFKWYITELTRTAPNFSHSTNFLICNSGNKYREPSHSPYSLNNGDTFYVNKTFLFNRPIALIYPQTNPDTIIKCGGLNESYLIRIAAVYVILVSFLSILNVALFHKINYNERLIFSGSALLCLLIFAFFY